jgi:hypothetical protein
LKTMSRPNIWKATKPLPFIKYINNCRCHANFVQFKSECGRSTPIRNSCVPKGWLNAVTAVWMFPLSQTSPTRGNVAPEQINVKSVSNTFERWVRFNWSINHFDQIY